MKDSGDFRIAEKKDSTLVEKGTPIIGMWDISSPISLTHTFHLALYSAPALTCFTAQTWLNPNPGSTWSAASRQPAQHSLAAAGTAHVSSLSA